ncbi:MAG: thioredoxin [Bacteroidales bacterium]|nr:thioredoxin [Bacteroidales bacterium]
MKRLSAIMLMVFSFAFFSCSNIQGNREETKLTLGDGSENTASGTRGEVEYLTYDDFLAKVWNFEDNSQEWIYEGDVPCVIDFYADWCGPCKRVAPIMDHLAEKYNGKVKIYKINTDKERQLASAFAIRSIPAVLFVPMKGKPMMQVGALPKDQYIQIIETELLDKKENIK